MAGPRVESLCFRDGSPVKSFDNGHDSLKLTDEARAGESFELFVEAGTTTHFGRFDTEWFHLDTVELYAERPVVADLHRHVSVLNELYQIFDEDSPTHRRFLDAIVDASRIFAFDAKSEEEFHETATAALDHLRGVEEVLPSDISDQRLTAVGHAHLDLAWHWPWSETIRKAARSFTNVFSLLDEYPEFTFTQSMPPMYEWVRHRYPDLWSKIRTSIDEERWHPVGALWVETDVNAAGAETLARQFLLGKRYFREEFDVDPTVTFLPDTFGFSAGFPGIAAAADCPYLFTAKMSRNEINEFPHNTFRWEGIDGSEILAHNPAVDSYNGRMNAEEVTNSVYDDAQNHVVDDRGYLVGYGDGGGGPTREMVERKKVMDGIEALPDIEWDSIGSLFERLDEGRDDYPIWNGEIYVEYLRGTYNTGARIKRNTRRGEYLLKEAELWSALARATDSEFDYPYESLTKAWKIHLFNHFHDIVTRASIAEVYADADRDYEEVYDRAREARSGAIETLVAPDDNGGYLCLSNPLSWEYSTVAIVSDTGLLKDGSDVGVATSVSGDGTDPLAVQRTAPGIDEDAESSEILLLETPPLAGLGVTSVKLTGEETVSNPFDVSPTRLSNGLVTVKFDDDGTLTVTDEEMGREVLGEPGNRILLHPNESRVNKNVDQHIYQKSEELPAPEVEIIERGPVRATVRHRRAFRDSELVQDISLSRGSKRIDFRTRVEWHEEQKILKTYFPTGAEATTATYDTHFGYHQRSTHNNTSWDAARWEEPGGQWVDVSEPEYGVAVLNNCKYGVHVEKGEISQTLLRSQRAPDPQAELGTQLFTYSLLPHKGGAVAGGVNQAACELNATTEAFSAVEPVSLSPISVDDDGIIVESVKQSEDHDDRLVLRLYESEGNHTSTSLDLDLPIVEVHEANLVEDVSKEMSVNDSTVTLEFDPFEIRTLVVRLE